MPRIGYTQRGEGVYTNTSHSSDPSNPVSPDSSDYSSDDDDRKSIVSVISRASTLTERSDESVREAPGYIRVSGFDYDAKPRDLARFFEGIDMDEEDIYLRKRVVGEPKHAYIKLTRKSDVRFALRKHNEYMGRRYVWIIRINAKFYHKQVSIIEYTQSELDRLHRRVDKLESERAEDQRRIRDLEDDIRDIRDENDDLHDRLDRHREDIMNLSQQIEGLQVDLRNVQQENRALRKCLF